MHLHAKVLSSSLVATRGTQECKATHQLPQQHHGQMLAFTLPAGDALNALRQHQTTELIAPRFVSRCS